MVRLFLRGAAIAVAASACWSCGSDANGAPTSSGPDSGGDVMGGSSSGAGDDAEPTGHDAGSGVDAADSGGADASAQADVASTAFTLTSSAFADRGNLSAIFDCGSDVSPPLAWTPGPAGTQSYGVVLTDAQGLYYWILWDIPATTTSLPQGVDHLAMPATPAGSEQIASGLATSTWSGYAGPCPELAETPYTFAVYALSVATLPGITTSSTGAAVFAAMQASTLAGAKLTGLATRYKS
jgi:Raf kinase inhibitor-like YbhB/YbcL family protein